MGQAESQPHHYHNAQPFYPGEAGLGRGPRPAHLQSAQASPSTSGAGARRPRPVHTEPGAFDIQGSQQQTGQIRAQVRIPPGVRPGQHFAVLLENQQVMVRCPERAAPGDLIAIEFQPSTFVVQVPEGVYPGQVFDVMVRGVRQRVTCPDGVRPGMQIRFSIPSSSSSGQPGTPSGSTSMHGGSNHNQGSTAAGGQQESQEPTPFEKLYEVVVPRGVRPGEPFVLLADGQRVTVTCPLDARPNQKIRFKLPIVPTNEELQAYEVHYNKDGWVRSLGVDLKFHWIRVDSTKRVSTADNNGENPPVVPATLASALSETKFSIEKTALVKALVGPRQELIFIPPKDLAIETTIPGLRINFQTLSRGAQLPFEQKIDFFRQNCDKLRVPWEKGHIEIRVRRSQLLADSLMAFEKVSSENLRKIFRFEFLGEPAIDAGGVAREWYDQVTDALFNPDFGLFQYSSVDQMCMQINPASHLIEQHHDRYFRFLGRLMGKALFDRQVIRHHLVRPVIKHILGWPVVLADLEYLDSETLANLSKLQGMDAEMLESLCLDFTVMENFLGQSKTIDLVPNGADMTLSKDNLDLYLEANLRYRLCDRFKVQLRELLVGFYECIPEALLSIFDFQQLELLLCGMPNIDISDWMSNTEYGGDFARQGSAHSVVRWFWEVVRDDFDQEQKARLLQFVTGTSGVPAQGFAFLQGNDGNIRKFTINSIPLEQSLFPRAHTCFNRIDLPLYRSKKDLKEKLSLATQMESSGFDIE